MLMNYDVVKKEGEVKLQDLETELYEANDYLRKHRKNMIVNQLSTVIESKMGDVFTQLSSNEKNEVVKKYYNEALEIDYTALTNDHDVSEDIIASIQKSLVEYYDEQQISINVYKTTYAADEKLVEKDKDYFNEFFNENGFTNIHVLSYEYTGNYGVEKEYYSYAKQVKYAITEVKQHLESHTDDEIDIDYEFDNMIKNENYGEVANKIIAHNVGLSSKQVANIENMLETFGGHCKRVSDNTGRLVRIEKNNFTGDNLISTAYITDDFYNEDNAVGMKVLEVAVMSTAGKIVGDAVSSKLSEVLNATVDEIKAMGIDEKVIQIGKNISKKLSDAGIEKINREVLTHIYKNRKDIIADPMKTFSDSFNEINNLQGLTSNEVSTLSKLDTVVGGGLAFAPYVMTLSPLTMAAGVLGGVVSIGLEMYKENISISQGEDLYTEVQENFDFENRFSEENLIKAVPSNTVIELNEGYNNAFADGINTNKVIGNESNNNISIITGDNNIIEAKGGDDVLDGSNNSDTLKGGAGDDTYIYGKNDGKDIIEDYTFRAGRIGNNGKEKLIIKDYQKENIVAYKNGPNINILFIDEKEVSEYSKYSTPGAYAEANQNSVNMITIKYGGHNSYGDSLLFEEVQFESTGDTISMQELLDYESTMLSSEEEVINYDLDNTIEGRDDEDHTDIINAGAGDDIINGGKGDDVLQGGTGRDKYYFEMGDGYDYISEEGYDTDRIIFKDLSSIHQINLEKNSGNLIINYGASDHVEIKDYFNSSSTKVEKIIIKNNQYNISDLVYDAFVLNNDESDQNSGGNTGESGGNDNGSNESNNNDVQFYFYNDDGEFEELNNTKSKVVLNNEVMEMYYSPYNKNGRTMASLREMTDRYDSSIEIGWEADEKKAHIVYNGKESWIDYDDSKYCVEGAIKNMSVAPEIIWDNKNYENPTMMVDMKVISEILDFEYARDNGYVSVSTSNDSSDGSGDYYENDFGNEYDITIRVNGRKVNVNKIAYLDEEHSRTMVDVKAFMTKINEMSTIDHSFSMPHNQKIVITHPDGSKSIAEAGSDEYTVNNSTTYNHDVLDVESQMKDGKLMVPVRFISQMLDANVSWNGEDYIVELETDEISYIDSGNIDMNEYDDIEDVVFGNPEDNDSNNSGSDNSSSGSNDDGMNLVAGNDDDNTLYGTDGNDRVRGKKGNDTLYGNDGNDIVAGEEGNDTISGGKGNDELAGGDGFDVYKFKKGFGEDMIFDNGGINDTIYFQDILKEEIELYKGEDKEHLYIDIKATDDRIKNYGFFDRDTLQIDKIKFADNKIYKIVEENGVVFLEETIDAIEYDSSDNIEEGTNRDDEIYGKEGDDEIKGLKGDDIIYGNEDNDEVYGNDGNDILNGGKDDDLLLGLSGEDTYIFSEDFGEDRIWDDLGVSDKIVFEDLSKEKIVLEKDENDLLISIKDSDNNIFIFEQFNENEPERGIEKIQCNDGRVYKIKESREEVYLEEIITEIIGNSNDDSLYGTTGKNIIHGKSGNDTIRGNKNDDVIDGGRGNDYLEGASGNDAYRFSRGFGKDRINDFGNDKADKIVFEDINKNEVAFLKTNDNNLVIHLESTDDKVVIERFFGNEQNKVEKIQFSGTGEYDLSNLIEQSGLTIIGTSSSDILDGLSTNDYIQGFDGDDIIYGNSGNDHLYGNDGDDILAGDFGHDLLEGDDGKDKLYGNNGNDELYGGTGNDKLHGGIGHDSYFFSKGFGNDELTDQGDVDKIVLNDILKSEVKFSKRLNDNDLIVDVTSTNDRIKIKDYYKDNQYKIEKIEFGDGTINQISELVKDLPMIIPGRSSSEVIEGTTENDIIKGLSGDDILYGKEGNDKLYGNKDNDFIVGNTGNDSVVGNDGDDKLYGNSGNDILNGGKGIDYLEGGQGNDIYEFDQIFGQDIIEDTSGIDKIIFHDALQDDIKFSIAENTQDLLIESEVTEERLKINEYFHSPNHKIEKIIFKDGVEKELASLTEGLETDLYGTEGNDVLQGNRVANRIEGFSGDDTLKGGLGNDTYFFESGFGNDVIEESAGIDKIVLSDIKSDDVRTFKANNNKDLLIENIKTEDSLLIKDYFSAAGSKVEKIELSDGQVRELSEVVESTIRRIIGTEGNDVLQGNRVDNRIEGLSGNDTLKGGLGNDTYFFESGFGNDVIEESAGIDKIVLSDIKSDDVRTFKANNNKDLLIENIKTEDSLLIKDYFSAAGSKVEKIELSDGQVRELSEVVESTIRRVVGTEGNDVLQGNRVDNRIEGFSGDDTLKGNIGDDLLKGGTGNDTLQGDQGSDIYEFSKGFGKDKIVDVSEDYSSTEDTIVFKDISKDEISLLKNDKDLLVEVKSTGDQLQIKEYFSSDRYKVEKIQFANGESLEVNELINEIPLYTVGTQKDDRLSGHSGDDILIGGLGNDTYFFESGFGNDVIVESAGIDKIVLSDIKSDDVRTFKANNNKDLLIENIKTEDSLLIKDYFSATGSKVEKIELSDGQVRELSEVVESTIRRVVGTEGNDVLQGNRVDNRLEGFSGDDTLEGDFGNDQLYGGKDNDTLIGGKGDDYLEGGLGKDVYEFRRGFGHDVIDEGYRFYNKNYEKTKIEFINISQEEIIFERKINSEDIVLKVKGTNDQIIIKDYFRALIYADINDSAEIISYDPFELNFSDNNNMVLSEILVQHGVELYGTNESDSIQGSLGKDKLYGRDGMDGIYGYAGADYLYGGKGNDYIYAGSGDDWIEGNDGNDVVRANSGDDIIYGHKGDDELYGFLNNDTLYGGKGDDSLYGGKNKDIIYAGEGNDLLEGGTGNDTLQGDQGSDIYEFSKGFGKDKIVDVSEDYSSTEDTIVFKDISKDEISLLKIDKDLLVEVKSTGDQLRIKEYFSSDKHKVEKIQFADGEPHAFGELINELSLCIYTAGTKKNDRLRGTTEKDYIKGLAGNDRLYGRSGADIIDGGKGNDYLRGQLGNDILIGNEGNDILRGDRGSDIYEFSKGFGKDRIVDYSYDYYFTKDTIVFKDISKGEIELSANRRDLLIKVKDTADQLRIRNYFLRDNYKVENIIFKDGQKSTMKELIQDLYIRKSGTERRDRLRGTTERDNIKGYAGNDLLYGLEGNDLLEGGKGNDVYVYRAGDGEDIIHDEFGKNLLFIRNITPDDVKVTIDQYYQRTSIKAINSMDSISWGYNYYDEEGQIDMIKDIWFSNGVRWDYNDFIQKVNENTIEGSEYSDNLFGLDIEDSEVAVYGYAGDDMLYGNSGNDILVGGSGDDTYNLNYSWGDDTIINNSTSTDEIDRINLWDDFNNLIFSYKEDNLLIDFLDQDRSITIEDWRKDELSKIDEIATTTPPIYEEGAPTNNRVLYQEQVELLIEAMASFTSENGISWQQALKEKNQEALDIIDTYVANEMGGFEPPMTL